MTFETFAKLLVPKYEEDFRDPVVIIGEDTCIEMLTFLSKIHDVVKAAKKDSDPSFALCNALDALELLENSK